MLDTVRHSHPPDAKKVHPTVQTYGHSVQLWDSRRGFRHGTGYAGSVCRGIAGTTSAKLAAWSRYYLGRNIGDIPHSGCAPALAACEDVKTFVQVGRLASRVRLHPGGDWSVIETDGRAHRWAFHSTESCDAVVRARLEIVGLRAAPRNVSADELKSK